MSNTKKYSYKKTGDSYELIIETVICRVKDKGKAKQYCKKLNGGK